MQGCIDSARALPKLQPDLACTRTLQSILTKSFRCKAADLGWVQSGLVAPLLRKKEKQILLCPGCGCRPVDCRYRPGGCKASFDGEFLKAPRDRQAFKGTAPCDQRG